MDPQIQHYGFSLIWIYFSSLFVFLAGIWEIRLVSKQLKISEIKSFSLYLWHTLITIIHYLWLTGSGGGDIVGTYLNSLDPGFTSPYLGTLTVTKFYSILSILLRFSFFTTFLVVNIFATNALMIIEYFYKKYSKEFPLLLRNICNLFIWLPVLSFWTCLAKDAFMLLSVLLITFSLEKFNKRSYLLIPAIAIAACLRSYVTIIFIISILISNFSTKGVINSARKILIFLIVAISIYFVFPLVNDYIFKGGFENLGSLIEKRNFYTNITSMGTYAIDPSSNALWKIFSYSFRPLFYDAYSIFGLLLSIDSAILLSIFSYLLILSIKLKRILFIFSNQFLIFCSSSTIIIGLGLSLTTSNLGLASRHKWMFLPVAFIGFMRLFFDYYQNKFKD